MKWLACCHAASCVVDCRFEPWSGQTKDYKICICCFSAKHAAFRSKSKNWLVRNQDNVSEWGDISLSVDCCFSEYRVDLTIISLKINLFSPYTYYLNKEIHQRYPLKITSNFQKFPWSHEHFFYKHRIIITLQLVELLTMEQTI